MEKSKIVDIDHLLSLGSELVGVLKNHKDHQSLMLSVEESKELQSSCLADSNEVQKLLEACKSKISTCKEKIENDKREASTDSGIGNLENELEMNLKYECTLRQDLRVVTDELADLESKRISIEKQRDTIRRQAKDMLRAQNTLSMCVSVMRIIPVMNDPTRISGFVVDREKKKAEKFDFDAGRSPPFETCDRLRKMTC